MKRSLKKITLTTAALLFTAYPIMGMDATPIKESELCHSQPLYATYLSNTAREKVENLLTEVLSVLSDQILMHQGVQPWDILNASKNPDFNVDVFIPKALEGEDREAVGTVAVHYVHLNFIRNILANALARDINLNWKKDINFLLADCNFTFEEVPKLRKRNSKVFRATQVVQLVASPNDEDQEPPAPQTRVLYFATVSELFDTEYLRQSLSILFRNEPTNDPLKEPLNDQSLTLQQIINAYEFLKSYAKIPPNNLTKDFTETFSAGVELRDALDYLLGTKHVNLMGGHMYTQGPQYDSQKRNLLAKREEVRALQAELDDSTLTDQKVRSKLKDEMRRQRAELSVLERSIKMAKAQDEQDALTGFINLPFSNDLIEQAKMRQKVLLMLKKVSDLFSDAFIESQDSRLNFIKKRFDLTK